MINTTGEPTELRYALTGYGIPQQLLPLSNTGTVKTANHSRWIYALRAKAQRETRNLNGEIQQRSDGEVEEIVDCPGSRDVIFRKGPTFKNNPGNMYFRELIESTQDKHTQGSRKEKCNITWNIVNEVLASNGRFLNWSSKKEMWIVATDLENIRKKVAACYKQYNRTVLTFQQQQQQQQQRLSSQKRNLSPKKVDDLDQQKSKTNEEIPKYPVMDDSKVDRQLREYYDAALPSTKRRKMAGIYWSGYSSSDSSDCGCVRMY